MFSTFAVSFLLCLSLASNLFRPRCMSCLVNSATYETGFDTELGSFSINYFTCILACEASRADGN